MVCPNCAAPVTDGQAFCAVCGARLGASEPLKRPAGSDSSPERSKVYAGFWRRAAALLIDIAFLSLLYSAIKLALAPPATAFHIFTLAGTLLYFAGMESSAREGTLGKMALGIKVTDLKGRRIGFGRAVGRQFARVLSTLPLYIGYVVAAFTPRKQAFHDMIAGTLVLHQHVVADEAGGSDAHGMHIHEGLNTHPKHPAGVIAVAACALLWAGITSCIAIMWLNSLSLLHDVLQNPVIGLLLRFLPAVDAVVKEMSDDLTLGLLSMGALCLLFLFVTYGLLMLRKWGLILAVIVLGAAIVHSGFLIALTGDVFWHLVAIAFYVWVLVYLLRERTKSAFGMQRKDVSGT